MGSLPESVPSRAAVNEPPGTGTAEEVPPASRRELAVLAVYFVALIAATDVINVRPGIELMAAAAAVAALVISRQPARFVADWWFFLLGLVAWNLSGAVAAGSPVRPHLDFMLNLDRVLLLGRDPVVVVQHSLASAGHIGPLDVIAAVTYNLHLPEPFIVSYFLWRISRPVYFQFAAAVLCLLVLGFVTFILFPAIPPWMASTWYHRIPYVYNGFGPVLRWYPMPFHGTPIFYLFQLRGDAVAAFPSEHAALPMLELLFLSRVAPRATPWLILWVLWVLFVVVYLGEHWVTDVLAGWLYAVILFRAIRAFTGASLGAARLQPKQA